VPCSESNKAELGYYPGWYLPNSWSEGDVEVLEEPNKQDSLLRRLSRRFFWLMYLLPFTSGVSNFDCQDPQYERRGW